jgi:hypothetical protein
MLKTLKGFRFECSGREMDTFGFDGFSIFEGVVGVGKDCRPEFFNNDTKLYSTEFSDEEKKELAEYMISQWVAFSRTKA